MLFFPGECLGLVRRVQFNFLGWLQEIQGVFIFLKIFIDSLWTYLTFFLKKKKELFIFPRVYEYLTACIICS